MALRWVLSVALLYWVSQSLVLGVGLGVVGHWVLLDVGPRNSWLSAWWVALLVGLPVHPSGVSGGPSPLLAEGCWVLWGFLCCVPLCCGRCSRFCVLCVFVGLVWVAAVVVCVLCARVCLWCVGGAFLCLSSPLWAWVAGSVWVLGLCVVVSRLSWLWGQGVVPLHSWLGSVGGGVLSRRPLCVPPPPSSLPRRLACCSPGALSGTTRAVVGVRWGWLGGGGLMLAWVPFPGVFPLGGRCLHASSECNSVVRAVHLYPLRINGPAP